MMVRYIGFLIFLLIFRFQELKNIAKIFPPREDFVDVCAAITLIQENYDLNTTDLAKGQIIMKNVSKNIPIQYFKMSFVISKRSKHLKNML